MPPEPNPEPNGVAQEEGEKVENGEKVEENQEEAWNARVTATNLPIEAVFCPFSMGHGRFRDGPGLGAAAEAAAPGAPSGAEGLLRREPAGEPQGVPAAAEQDRLGEHLSELLRAGAV